MKMTLNEIDEQIREVENRIAVERIALDDAVNGCTNSLRETVTSPKTLLALLGIGFAVGKIMFKGKAEADAGPVKKAGVLGLLTGVAGTALSLTGSRFGWGNVASWAARKYFSRKQAASAAGTSPRTSRSSATYPRTPAGV